MECVQYAINTRGISAARACRLFNVNLTNVYYQKKMPQKDVKVKELIESNLGRGNCGRKAVIASIRKSHPELGSSKIRRVYVQHGFSLYKRMKKRRIKNPPNPIAIPFSANEEWAVDFMSDALVNGRRFRTLNVVDQYNRQCLGIHVGHCMPTRRVIAEMEKIIDRYGKPMAIRTDNGPEFISKAFQTWLKENGIKWSPIEKGKPQHNGIVERFNRTYREDILDANLFHTVDQAQQLTDDWITYYNDERPHQALNYKTPLEYAA